MAKKKSQWLLPTNTENLKMIIAQGLISSSNGFTKYYSDILELVPNYIPLFKDELPSTLLSHVISEDNSLTPVILDIDLKKISSGIKILQDDKLVNLEGDVDSADVLFILAPLPLSVISTLAFSSKAAVKEFEESSKLYSNVVLNDLKLSATVAEQKLFKSSTLSVDWINDLKKIETINEGGVDYKKVYAYGGLLLNLFYFAKNGNLSNNNYKLFSDFVEEKKRQDIDIYDYFKDFNINDADIKKKMDNGLIDIAINSKDFKEDVLKFLEYGNWEKQAQKRTQELADKLKGFESNTNKTVSEQFHEAKTPLEKILLMLFLREDTEALMEYTLELFCEEDYINFAMMFGIRDKFIKMPKELREFTGLQSFVSLKMAEYAHATMESNIKFKSTVKPLTVMELFNKNSLKKRLIKELEVESCIKTIMPNKEYFSKSGINTYIGFIEPKYETLEEEYFKILSKRKITKEEYNNFAKMK
ncbi:MAG: hypothetical protein KAI79_07315 [Bacteroidales bacterium]|nr:hypothetical protein [Bacteroidales bacterium]